MARVGKGKWVVTTVLAIGVAIAFLWLVGPGAAAALQSSPTPIDGCTVIDQSGEYELTGNITNETARICIDVQASNVTVYGRGYAIDGVDGNGTGLSVRSENVTVQNLTVEHWNRGIYSGSANRFRNIRIFGSYRGLEVGSENTFDNLTIHRSEDVGIYLDGSHNNSFDRITVTDSGNGSFEEGYGMYFWGANDNTFSRTVVEENGGMGIYLREGDDNRFEDTEARENGGELAGSGIYQGSGINNTYINTTTFNNTAYGIYLRGGDNATVYNASIQETGVDTEGIGIYIDGVGNSTVERATVHNTAANGIWIRSAANTWINDVVVRNSGGSGISVDEKNSTLENVDVANSNGTGISIEGSNSTVFNASVDGSQDGMYVSADDVEIRESTIVGSQESGLYLGGGRNARVLNSTVRDTGGGLSAFGIYVRGLDDTTIRDTLVHNASEAGIYVRSAEGTRLEDVVVQESGTSEGVGEAGIRIERNDTTVTNASVRDNDGPGIYVYTDDTTIEESTVTGSGGIGIHLDGGNNNTVSRSVVNGSGGPGIELGSENTSVEDVVVHENGSAIHVPGSPSGTVVRRADIGNSTAANTVLSFDAAAVRIGAATDPPSNPSGTGIGRYFEAETTSTSGYLNVSLEYQSGDVENVNESNLTLMEHDGSSWSTVAGSSVDTTANVVSANVTNFSTFGVFEESSSSGGISECTMITETGWYELGSDITNGTADPCIDIQASDVILDGAGHEIDGVDGNRTGILVRGSTTNVTIQNLSVRSWNDGINHRGTDGQVRSVALYNNSADGATISGSGIEVTDVTGQSNDVALHLAGPGNTASNNNLSGDNDVAIRLTGDNNTVRNNLGTTNNHWGIQIFSEYNTVEGNEMRDHIAGLIVSGHNNTLVGNRLNENSDGISLRSTDNNIVLDNTANDNSRRGIDVREAGSVFDNRSSDHNVISNNTLHRNGDWAISIRDGSTNNTIDNLDIGNSTAGNTTVSLRGTNVSLNAEPAPPDNPEDPGINRYFDTTSEGADAFLNVSLQYDDADVTDVNESDLHLWQYDGSWVSVDSTVDTTVNYLAANVTSFGTFGAFEGESASRTAIDSCRVIDSSGQYELVTNLSSSDTCLEITADSVTIDGQGYHVTGVDVEGFRYGIEAAGVTDVSLRNLYIDGWGDIFNGGAVRFRDASRVAIRKSTITNNGGNAIDAYNSTTILVEDNYFEENRIAAVRIGKDPFDSTRVRWARNATVRNNTIRSHINFNIVVGSATNTTISGNTVTDNRFPGTWINGSSGTRVAQNVVRNNQFHGILVAHSTDTELVSNEIVNTSRNGIDVRDSDDAIISNNVVTESGETGIYLTRGRTVRVTDNEVRKANWTGIVVGTNETSLQQNLIPTDGQWSVLVKRNRSGVQVNDADVGASTAGDTSVSFDGRNVRVRSVSSPPENPHADGIGRYVEIAEAFTGDGYLDVRLHYDDSDVAGSESDLRLWRHDGSGWAPVTGSTVDTEMNVVSARIADPTGSMLGVFARTDEGPFFAVDVTGTNHPVAEGETLSVDVTVTNLGTDRDAQDVVLRDFDGTQRDILEGVGIAPGESRAFTLEWTDTSIGGGNVTVSSGDHTDATPVRIHDPSREPVTRCRALDTPGEYVLATDFIYDDTRLLLYNTCVWIPSSDVTLHGQGHSVTADTPDRGTNLLAFSPSEGIQNVHVSNVRHFGTFAPLPRGVAYDDVSGGSIDGMSAQRTGNGIEVWNAGDIAIADSRLELLTGTGIRISAAENTTIRETTILESRLGIEVFNGATDTHVIDTTVHGSEQAAMEIRGEFAPATGTVVERLDIGASTAANTSVSFEGENVSIAAAESPPANPDADGLGRYFVAESLTPSAFLDVDLHYRDGDVTDLNESNLDLWRYDSAGWSTVESSSVDTEGNVLSGQLSGFSTFGGFAQGSVSSQFAVSIDDVTDPVEAGETLEVAATVENAGGTSETAEIALVVDGSTVAGTDVRLESGETRSVTFEWVVPEDQIGESEVTVTTENARASTTVLVYARIDEGTEEQGSGLAVSLQEMPGVTVAGNTVLVEVSVENTASSTVTDRIKFTVADHESSREVSLESNASTTVTFSWEPSETHVGTHEVAVGTGSSTVTSSLEVKPRIHPAFVGAEVRDEAPATVEVRFDRGISLDSATADTAGLTVTRNGEEAAIVSVDASESTLLVTLSESVRADETVTVGYDSGSGNVQSYLGVEASPFADAIVDNRVDPVATAVEPVLPETDVEVDEVEVGSEVRLTADDSEVPDDADPVFEWEVGGESFTTDEPVLMRSFDEPGTVTATVTIQLDDETVTAETAFDVVDTTAPDASLQATTTVTTGENPGFDATASADNVAIRSYEWDFGDGTTRSGESLTRPDHTYEEPGEYEVTLTVTDASGNTATNSTTVVVEADSNGGSALPDQTALGIGLLFLVAILVGLYYLTRRRRMVDD